MERHEIIFYLNGQRTAVSGADCFMMFAEWLRRQALKTGTKIVCAEGDCGACTVLVASLREMESSNGGSPFKPINSCIRLVAQLDQHSIITVEGLALPTGPTRIQRSMMAANASQCGYCTPGFVSRIAP